MPMYEYKCPNPNCNHQQTEYMKMCAADEAPKVICKACHALSYPEVWFMERQVASTHAPQLGYHKPIEMYSVALEDLGEIRKMQRECPDCEISDDPRNPLYGVPVANSRTGKNQALKSAGFHEIN